MAEAALKGYTFQPSLPRAGKVPVPPEPPLPRRRHRESTSSPPAASQFLGRVAAGQALAKSRLQAKTAQVRAAEVNDATFQPKLMAKSLVAAKTAESSATTDSPRAGLQFSGAGEESKAHKDIAHGSVFERLNRGSEVRTAKIASAAAKIAEAEAAECTFAPEVGASKPAERCSAMPIFVGELGGSVASNEHNVGGRQGSLSGDTYGNKGGLCHDASIYERLYSQAATTAAKVREAGRQAEAKAVEGLSFKPTLVARQSGGTADRKEVEPSKGNNRSPAASRGLVDADREELKELRVEMARMREVEGCTFAPETTGRDPIKPAPGFSARRHTRNPGANQPVLSGSVAAKALQSQQRGRNSASPVRSEATSEAKFADDSRPVHERLLAQKVNSSIGNLNFVLLKMPTLRVSLLANSGEL